MAKIGLLIDTDVVIDALRGVKPARELFRQQEIEIYCSLLTKKELLSKRGLSNAEMARIERLLAYVKIVRIDNDIASKYASLLDKYGEKSETMADFVMLPRHGRRNCRCSLAIKDISGASKK